jgi:hypothetical protein
VGWFEIAALRLAVRCRVANLRITYAGRFAATQTAPSESNYRRRESFDMRRELRFLPKIYPRHSTHWNRSKPAGWTLPRHDLRSDSGLHLITGATEDRFVPKMGTNWSRLAHCRSRHTSR